MKIQDYNLDDPIPTSCAQWGSLNFSHNPTATEVGTMKDQLYASLAKKTVNPSVIADEFGNFVGYIAMEPGSKVWYLLPWQKDVIDCWVSSNIQNTSLGHTDDQAQQKQKEKDMCYNTKASAAVAAVQVMPDRSDDEKRQHLRSQLRDAKFTKYREAEKFFNLFKDNSPKNFRELIAAIKDGKFQIDEKRAAKIDAKIMNDEPLYGSPFDGIIWDGPQPDQDGFTAFAKFLDKEYEAAKDEIVVLDLEKGLEALRRFQALEVAAKA